MVMVLARQRLSVSLCCYHGWHENPVSFCCGRVVTHWRVWLGGAWLGERGAMSDVLFIKTSSLGDVIHQMPAVTELRRNRPSARIAWVVEEAFAPLVGLNSAVDAVIQVNSRAWRHRPLRLSTWREAADFLTALRART